MEKENFEQSMESLENIVTELEDGKLNLDESVKKFEEGMKIAQKCNNMLENAEKKISILLEKNGELEESEFDTNQE
ncbi:MAG: exodeoxyribonuclease VII small subunit [Clostridium sp. 26_21]|nr:MAG: exodeoxyribonuclease VII small subunit [Clostridium sp. 26_21]